MVSTLITAPDNTPVSLSEAKDHMRVTGNDDDIYILNLIKAATAEVENVTRRSLVTQTWGVFINGFSTEIEIPKAPLQSVTSISYIDLDGATQTLAASVYTVDTNTDPGYVRIAYNQSWPSVRSQSNAIEIRIVCGYGNPSDVPAPIKQAILIQVAHLYESREIVLVGAPVAVMPMSYENLLSSYRVIRF